MININKNYNSLEGKFLIASPGMSDPRFYKCIVYMISDSKAGSMGIIINKPALNVSLENLLKNAKINIENSTSTRPQIFYGGPMDLDKGFILHSNDYTTKEKFTKLGNNLILSSNFNILKDIIKGKGPSKSILAIGYAGWHSHQLVNELKQNTWIESELDTEILFSNNINKKWEFALEKVGINKKNISSSKFSSFSGSA